MLTNVLNCLYDTFSTVLRKNVEKKALFENIDLAFLILDEICDDGYFKFFFSNFLFILEFLALFWRLILMPLSVGVL
jgi:hypothetical protein